MSYDIRFSVKVAGAADDCYAVIGRPEYDSPTYNLREMFVACMGWDYKQGVWYPLKDVLPKIKRGVDELTYNEDMYTQYNPENGWGSTTSARKALKSIVDYFDPDSYDGYAGTWNADIPLDCIYMRW